MGLLQEDGRGNLGMNRTLSKKKKGNDAFFYLGLSLGKKGLESLYGNERIWRDETSLRTD